MTPSLPRRDRPSLPEAFSAALLAAALGALVAWTAAPVSAVAIESATTAGGPFQASFTRGPQWLVSPGSARPGEVVHVRIKYQAPVGAATGQATVPQVVFAFRNDPAHLVRGHVYAAEGTFGVDLVVPPGTAWGADPIVWWIPQIPISSFVSDQTLTLSVAQPALPFVASRSAQPPLWNR